MPRPTRTNAERGTAESPAPEDTDDQRTTEPERQVRRRFAPPTTETGGRLHIFTRETR